jgi:hypothetical protein
MKKKILKNDFVWFSAIEIESLVTYEKEGKKNLILLYKKIITIK